MSKSKHYSKYDYEDEEISISKTKEENKNKRRQKRLKAALKTKNIDEILRQTYEEDY